MALTAPTHSHCRSGNHPRYQVRRTRPTPGHHAHRPPRTDHPSRRHHSGRIANGQ